MFGAAGAACGSHAAGAAVPSPVAAGVLCESRAVPVILGVPLLRCVSGLFFLRMNMLPRHWLRVTIDPLSLVWSRSKKR